jgi:hypothetical protein
MTMRLLWKAFSAKYDKLRWERHVVRMGEMRNVYKILIGKPEGKRLLESPKRRREDNIRTELKKIGWEIVDFMHVT